MPSYNVEVNRDGRWWMIRVPEIDQLTQARRISEIADMAKSLIAISTATPLSDIDIRITGIDVPGVGDVAAAADRITAARTAATDALQAAQDQAADYARSLTAAGVPVRDTAELLHVSPQRVSQLTN